MKLKEVDPSLLVGEVVSLVNAIAEPVEHTYVIQFSIKFKYSPYPVTFFCNGKDVRPTKLGQKVQVLAYNNKYGESFAVIDILE